MSARTRSTEAQADDGSLAVAEDLRLRFQEILQEAWSEAGTSGAPTVSVKPYGPVREGRTQPSRSLEIGLRARSASLRLSDRSWYIHPKTLSAWDAGAMDMETATMRDTAALIARRERAAMRHSVGARGTALRHVLVDRSLLVRQASGAGPDFAASARDILASRRADDPAFSMHHGYNGIAVVTLHDPDSTDDGRPILVPNPVTISQRDGPDDTWEDRLVLHQRDGRLQLGLVGATVPETVLAGAAGGRVGDLCDFGDILEPRAAQDLSDRTIAEAAHGLPFNTGVAGTTGLTLTLTCANVEIGLAAATGARLRHALGFAVR